MEPESVSSSGLRPQAGDSAHAPAAALLPLPLPRDCPWDSRRKALRNLIKRPLKVSHTRFFSVLHIFLKAKFSGKWGN